jgi:DNA-binding LacI/PurR family transcriptional regulator
MAYSQPTSVDVARLAGVNQSTVSRAFDPNSRISAKTRQRVMDAAEELGYQPNVIARSLISQRTDIVGIVMANLTASHFYPQVLEQFTHRLQEMGKQVLLLNTPPDSTADEMLPRALGYQVDAVIIVSLTPGNEIIEVSNRRGRPVILFNRYIPDTSANVVCCDNIQGGRLVADFLFDAGHTRIAYIAGSEKTTTNRMREHGFTQQLRSRGYDDLIREQAFYSYQAGREAARRLLTTKSPPDAVFCAADIIAMGAMDTARYELGLRIPEDLSVVGFDDVPAAEWPTYDLTTIRQPVSKMITTTLELLDRDVEDAPQTEVHLLPVELVIRGSARTATGEE